MDKFTNAKSFLDEIEKHYDSIDGSPVLNPDKMHLLEMAADIWKTRMGIEMTLGFMGGMVEKSYTTHMESIKALDSLRVDMGKWREEDKLKAEKKLDKEP